MKNDKPHSAVEAKLQNARSRYAREWGEGNARKFAVEGYYPWMSGFLRDKKKVLEVGVGNGSSTLALLKAGCTVIGIDENPACLEAAGKLLASNGVDFTQEQRGHIDVAARGYSIRYAFPHSSFPGEGCLLLEGDIMSDGALLEWITSNGRVDAIACWLMGTYQERAYNEVVASAGVRSPAAYRSTVQERICRIASQILYRDGIVHIVDRCLLTPDDSGIVPGSAVWLDQCEQSYNNRAIGTGMKVTSVDFLDYIEPERDAGPSVKLTRSVSGGDPDTSDKAFVSVVMGFS